MLNYIKYGLRINLNAHGSPGYYFPMVVYLDIMHFPRIDPGEIKIPCGTMGSNCKTSKHIPENSANK
jgi:hypothetical protein